MSAVITVLILKECRVTNYQTKLFLIFKMLIQFILTLLHAY